MAGDWIKYRDELHTHPRFLSLCNELILSEGQFGFAAYVSPATEEENIRNENVTELLLCHVTEHALRHIIMSLLLRVWSAVNMHCKVVEGDAVMQPMLTIDIDSIVGFEGFGDAMVGAGWIIKAEGNALIFPNFLDYNQPACLRKTPMTNAERQQRHRDKLKAEGAGVTKITKSNGREEKRREENKENTKRKFAPPTVEQVREYCNERKNGVDPETFVDFYQSNGWTQGRGKPIKDWRACIRTWEQRRRSEQPQVERQLEI